MDKRWLLDLYTEVGLEGQDAERAAEETRARLLRRERPLHERRSKGSVAKNLVRDPLVSMNRIIGRGDTGLPFYDDETQLLNVVAFGDVIQTIGFEPAVAHAFAKVVVEAFTANEFFQPLWVALGQTGPLDLEALRRLDWSSLRGDVPAPRRDPNQTAVTKVAQPIRKTAPTNRPLGRTPSVRPPPKKK